MTAIFSSVFLRRRQQVLDLTPHRGDLVPVLGDELQVGSAARADVVDAVDFRLDGRDDSLALENPLDRLVEPRGPLRQLGHLDFDGGHLLLREHELRSPLLELLVHGFGALQMVLGGLDLRGGVTLAGLDARELRDQLLLDGVGAREFVAERLNLRHPLGRLTGQRAAHLETFRQSRLLLTQNGLVTRDLVDARPCFLEAIFESGQPVGDRQQFFLPCCDGLDFLLRVERMREHGVALTLQCLELGAPAELFRQLAVHLGRERVKRVGSGFELVEGLGPGGDPGHLRVHLARQLAQPRRLLHPFVDRRQLRVDGVQRGVELRRPEHERRHALAERFESGPVGRQPVTELRHVGVGLVNLLELLPQRVELRAALLQRVVLPRRPVGQLFDLAEALVQRLEARLLLRELVGLG